MSSSRNNFEFIGNLGEAPSIKHLDNDRTMCRLFIITNKKWTDRDTGEKKESSEAFNVVAFGHHAKYLGQYARKGDKVLLLGEIRNSEWNDKETGEKRTGIEFVVSGYGADAMIFGKPVKNNTVQDAPPSNDLPPASAYDDQGSTAAEYHLASNGSGY